MQRKRLIKYGLLATVAWLFVEGAITVTSLRTASAEGQGQYALVLNNHLKLAVSMVWEGRHMHSHNIEAIKEFRRRFTDVAFIHFVSPAYFLGEGGDKALETFRSTLQKQDHVGVLLSGWKSIADGAGVPFRNAPTFFGHSLTAAACIKDCGLEVPLTVYSPDELDRLIQFSRDTLTEKGLGRPVAAMVSGWSSSPALADAQSRAGLRYDFSAVPPSLLAQRLKHYPIFDWVARYWSDITPYTQPYIIPAKPEALTEIPQNLAAIDYLTPIDATSVLEDYAQFLTKDPTSHFVFHLSLYQETASATLPKLTQILQNVFAYAERKGLNLRHLDLPDTGVRDKYAIEPLRYAPPGRFVH